MKRIVITLTLLLSTPVFADPITIQQQPDGSYTIPEIRLMPVTPTPSPTPEPTVTPTPSPTPTPEPTPDPSVIIITPETGFPKFKGGEVYQLAPGNYPGCTYAASGVGKVVTRGPRTAITGPWTITTGNVSLEGFSAKATAGGTQAVKISSGVANVELINLDIAHRGINTGTSDDGIYAASGSSNVTISGCYIHDCSRVLVLTRSAKNWRVINTIFARNSSSPDKHGEAWSDVGGSDIAIINCRFIEIGGTAIFAMLGHEAGVTSNVQFIGNVMVDCRTSNGIVATNTGATANNVSVINNTSINATGWNAGTSYSKGTGNRTLNNLWVGSKASAITISGEGGFNKIMDVDPFVDSAAGNYRLSTPLPGIAVEGEAMDPDGVARGADGVWDVGAFEYKETK